MLWTRTMGMTSELELETARRRARFETERRRVFAEMNGMTSRWRIAMVAPFHGLVIALLALHGFPIQRLLIQIGAASAMLVGFVSIDKGSQRRNRGLLFLCGTAILVTIGNTGGLCSPLLLSLVPFMVGVAMNPELENRRRHFVGKFLIVFGIMAYFARRYALPEPLFGTGPYATSEYVTIALASSVMSVVAVYNIGKSITGAYERLTLELAERREELCDENEGRTRALEGIAARLAHEVKNPLAAIKGLSTHMARQAEDAKMKERLSIVASEAERLQEIVDGFLSFSRGLDDLTVAPTKPYDIARELSTLLEVRANDLGIPLEIRGSRELSLDADSKKLRQALLNLVLNAMQASSKGSSVTVEVAKSCADGAAIVRVIDRGAGMTPDVLERIRKPYFTTKDGGSGLGIAIARGIIEQHGGTLDFESQRGRGTSAIVRLPAHATGHDKLPNPCRYAAAAMQKPIAVAGATVKETKPAPKETEHTGGDVMAPAFARASKVPS